MRRLPFLPANAVRLRLGLFVLTGAFLSAGPLHAQSAPTSTGSAKVAPGESSPPLGFSIETEMLTYRALESNSEAIACDVAAYLYRTTPAFKKTSPGSVCDIAITDSAMKGGVIILPFDRSVVADFQVWRSTMQTMDDFVKRDACVTNVSSATSGQPGNKVTLSSRGVGGSLLTLTPAGQALNVASGVLGLFASESSTSAVGGTIQDQAFMDDVSRELRNSNVPVLMPAVYTPYALTSIDAARSPFYNVLNKLLDTQDCLSLAHGKDDPSVTAITKFLDALRGSATPASKVGGGQTSPAPNTLGGTTPSAPPSSTSEMEAVLTGDGLAQQLGADPATGKIADPASYHILMLKALESGGSVSRFSNIFGTKISYSGGSVGTYALFNLNGQLECSGDVYDYSGSIASKDFQEHLRAYTPDPSKQVIFKSGGCRPQQ